MLLDFKEIAHHFTIQHENTNNRVQNNVDIIQLLREATGPTAISKNIKNINSVKFLNRKGLVKYDIKEDKIKLFPTLLFFYLTLVLKYDSYSVYKECIKLYHIIGDKLNNIKGE